MNADLIHDTAKAYALSPTEENLLIRDLGVPAAVLAPVILTLELSGRILRVSGGKLALSGS